jgi:hypothetical protein
MADLVGSRIRSTQYRSLSASGLEFGAHLGQDLLFFFEKIRREALVYYYVETEMMRYSAGARHELSSLCRSSQQAIRHPSMGESQSIMHVRPDKRKSRTMVAQVQKRTMVSLDGT